MYTQGAGYWWKKRRVQNFKYSRVRAGPKKTCAHSSLHVTHRRVTKDSQENVSSIRFICANQFGKTKFFSSDLSLTRTFTQFLRIELGMYQVRATRFLKESLNLNFASIDIMDDYSWKSILILRDPVFDGVLFDTKFTFSSLYIRIYIFTL